MSTQPLPINQFAKSVRDKYPGSYDHLSDEDLVGKVIQKYPQYKEHIQGMAETQFEKERTGGDRGFLSGAKEALGMNQPSPTLKDTLTDPGTYLGPGYGVAKTLLGAPGRMAREWKRPFSTPESTAASAVSPLAGLDPDAMAARAERADTGGILGQAAVPTAMAAAPLAIEGAMRGGNVLRNTAADVLRHPATQEQSWLGKPGTVKDIMPPQLQRWTLPPWLVPKGELGTPTNPGPFSRIPARLTKAQIAGQPDPVTGAPKPPTPSRLDISQVPEPVQRFPTENPGYMASVPRRQLLGLASSQKLGAGEQLQQLGQRVLYTPREGVGYPSPRERIPLGGESESGLKGKPLPFTGPPTRTPNYQNPLEEAIAVESEMQARMSPEELAAYESGMEAARRGAPGINPAVRSLRRKMEKGTL